MSKGQPQNPERRVDQTTFLRARSSSPIYIRGYLFFSSHPPPRDALELELRRRHHTGGLQRSVDTITSHIPILRPVTSVVPIGDTREENTAGKEIGPAGPQIPPDASGTVCRQCKLTPYAAQGDSQSVSNWSRDRTGHPTYSQIRLEQFADNVNSHPTSFGHGDPHADPKYLRGRGKIPRSQRSASRVINHRTISRSRQA